jgi:anhydro-N-acetylmuramic acid kinase
VKESTEVGLDVDAKEAIAFAVMAYETAHLRPSNVPNATGAKRSVVLGKLTPNGAPRASNGNGNGTSNGTASPSMSSAAHKAKAARSGKLSHASIPQKAKAAAR